MSDTVVRETLIRLIRDHGRGLVDDARRCEGLLRDLCPSDKREVNLLVGALKEGVPADLLRGPPAGAPDRAARKLELALGVTPELARWAAETWAMALGVSASATSLPPRPATAGERYASRDSEPAAVPPTPAKGVSGYTVQDALRGVLVGLLLSVFSAGLVGVSWYFLMGRYPNWEPKGGGGWVLGCLAGVLGFLIGLWVILGGFAEYARAKRW